MTIYAINAARMAPSTYSGPTILALTEHDGALYAVTATELLEYTGTDDTGTDIDAYVETGKMNFGNDQLKRFPRLYIEGTASKGMSVDVTAQERGVETSYTYPVSRWTGTLREQRSKLARGVKSRYAKIKVSNVDGGTFKLTKLSLLVRGLARRI